jgi:F-type H+-transporting ATPase subunit b
MTSQRSARSIWLAFTLCALMAAGEGRAVAQTHQDSRPAAAPAAGEHMAPQPAAQHGEAAPAEGHQSGEGEHDSGGLVPQVARLVNFALLVGTLVYFLKSPLVGYLRDRVTQVRSQLVQAGETRAAAAAQLAELEQKTLALPEELEALRRRGAEEAEAEETRMREAAYAERARQLDHAKREIEARLRLAERDLVRHTAALAVAIASERVKQTITDADQRRLADRYLEQVASLHGQQA